MHPLCAPFWKLFARGFVSCSRIYYINNLMIDKVGFVLIEFVINLVLS